MKIILITIVFIFSLQTIHAQDSDKTVTLTVSGTGKTQEEAKQLALRSAIEQAFGAFISSKTEIFNDQVVADQIASVANGNIKSFSILNESQLPNGSWGVTLKAIVSIGNLTSFVEAKGIDIEIKGGMFALNIKQQLLNEQGELDVINETFGVLHEAMQISFDYSIESGNPISIGIGSVNWEIPLKVTATANKNIDFCANYLIKILGALSLSPVEVTSYQSLNKTVFPVVINYNGIAKIFYLRNHNSANIIYLLTTQWEVYTSLFTIQSGMDESNGNRKGNFHNFSSKYGYINFLTSGQQAATFSWKDIRTLTEIEQLTGYKIKPKGVVSQFKHGGFVVYEDNGHGFVTSLTELGVFNDWILAKKACDELVLNGYSDWYLPTKDQLNSIYVNLKVSGVLKFFGDYEYWSSTKYNNKFSWRQEFGRGNQFYRINHEDNVNNSSIMVRAVRNF